MRRIFVLIAFFAAATAARADSLRVISPADGAVLPGGRFVTLSWSPEHLDRNAEEWEAFLSLDGGRYYSVRLTPHLDIAIHTFTVFIPNVGSDDVRLLFRTGNERHETIIDMPQQLRIRSDAAVVAHVESIAASPESARPDDPPVVMWNSGGRIETSAEPPRIDGMRARSRHSQAITLSSRSQPTSGGQAILPVRPSTDTIVCPPHDRAQRDVLLRISRINV